MKTRPIIALVLVASFLCSTARLQAKSQGAYDDYTADAMAVDAAIARPLYFGATIIGMGIFVATLPITLISKSTDKAAKSLVAKPAQMTFTRKLGKLSVLD